MIRKILLPLLVIATVGLYGCQEYGKVEQGITVNFDKAAKKVTILKDVTGDTVKPVYTNIPAITVALPVDPQETGADPKAGLCIALDADAKIITMYNPQTDKLEAIPFEIVDQHKGVDVNKKHVLVFDTATNKPREFPVINEAERTMTIYSKKQQLLVTIKVAESDFARYQAKDWTFGDEVRYYYKDPAQALRFMNITKTDIFKR